MVEKRGREGGKGRREGPCRAGEALLPAVCLELLSFPVLWELGKTSSPIRKPMVTWDKVQLGAL